MWRGVLLSVGVWAVLAVGLRATVMSPEYCPDVTGQQARASAVAAARWIEAAQRPDGTYAYQYNRETGEVTNTDYNLIRHAGVTMSLYQLAAAGDEDWVLGPADAALGYMQRNLTEHDGWVAFAPPGQRAALGSSALMLAGLTQRRDATGDDQYDELMRGLARFIVSMQEPGGAMLARWDPRLEGPVPGEYSKYYTGEAFWALAQMHNHFPAEGWDEPAQAIADYLSTRRDEAEGYTFPPWADQWAGYGLSEMPEWPVNDDNAAYARSLAERFGFLVRVESRRTDAQLSEWFHGPPTRAAGLGTWGEGLNGLYLLADADPRLADTADDIAERTACVAGLLATRQVTAEDAADGHVPELEAGAWFADGITRMDDQQHALSALLFAAPILEERERD